MFGLRLMRLSVCDRGASAIEYGLFAAALGLGITAALISTKGKLNDTVACVNQNLFIAQVESGQAAACGTAQSRAIAGAAQAQAYLLGLFPGKTVNTTFMAGRGGSVNLSNTMLFSDIGVMSQNPDGSWSRSTTMYNSIDGTVFQFASANPALGNDGLQGQPGSYYRLASDPNVFVSNYNPNFVIYKTDFGYYGLIMK